MRAIKVNSSTGNPELKNGAFQFVYDIDVVAQNCNHAMRQQLGELNYDALKGIEYFDNVYTGSPNFQRFEAQARTQLLAVDGVTSISSFEYELVTGSVKNVLEYSVAINTIYGSATISKTEAEDAAVTENREADSALVAAQRYLTKGVEYANEFGVV